MVLLEATQTSARVRRTDRTAIGLEDHDYLYAIRFTASIPCALRAARNYSMQMRPAQSVAVGPPVVAEHEQERSEVSDLVFNVLNSANASSSSSSPRHKMSPRRTHFVHPLLPRPALPRVGTADAKGGSRPWVPTDAANRAVDAVPVPTNTANLVDVITPTPSAVAKEGWANTALIHSPRSTHSSRRRLARRPPPPPRSMDGVLAMLPADAPAHLLVELASNLSRVTTSVGGEEALMDIQHGIQAAYRPAALEDEGVGDEPDEPDETHGSTPREYVGALAAPACAAPSSARAGVRQVRHPRACAAPLSSDGEASPTALAAWLTQLQSQDTSSVGAVRERKEGELRGREGSVDFAPGPISRWGDFAIVNGEVQYTI